MILSERNKEKANPTQPEYLNILSAKKALGLTSKV